MKARTMAVRAAALVAMAVAVMAAVPAANASTYRDIDWSNIHLGFGRARLNTLSSARSGSQLTAANQARLGGMWVMPLRDWDVPGVLPAPVVQIIGDF